MKSGKKNLKKHTDEARNAKELFPYLMLLSAIILVLPMLYVALVFRPWSLAEYGLLGITLLYFLAHGVVWIWFKRPLSIWRALSTLLFAFGAVLACQYLVIAWREYQTMSKPMFTVFHGIVLALFAFTLVLFWYMMKLPNKTRKEKKRKLHVLYGMCAVIFAVCLLMLLFSPRLHSSRPLKVFAMETFGFAFPVFIFSCGVFCCWVMFLSFAPRIKARYIALEQSTILQDETTPDASSKND